MKLKRIICTVLTIGVMLSASGCINQHPEQKDSGELRIVATSPAVADICNKLKLELVGVCSTSGTLPEVYKNVTKVGSPMSPDVEILKSLKPDYVLSPKSLEGDLKVKYDTIGLKSIFLDLKSVEGMYASIAEIGNKFNAKKEAAELVEEYNRFIDKYKEKNQGENAPKVLILMGLPGSYVAATEHSYVGSLVKLAGGVNVYQEETDEFVTANTEDMKSKNPDIILRTAHAMPEQVMQMFADEFKSNDIWKHFDAVKNKRVYDLESNLFGMSAKFNYPEALEALQPIVYGEE